MYNFNESNIIIISYFYSQQNPFASKLPNFVFTHSDHYLFKKCKRSTLPKWNSIPVIFIVSSSSSALMPLKAFRDRVSCRSLCDTCRIVRVCLVLTWIKRKAHIYASAGNHNWFGQPHIQTGTSRSYSCAFWSFYGIGIGLLYCLRFICVAQRREIGFTNPNHIYIDFYVRKAYLKVSCWLVI